MGDQAVQMLKGRTWDIEVAAADIVHSFVVNEERTIGVLDRRVSGQDRVVGLDNGGGDSWSGVNSEFELGFLAIVGREALKQEGTESRSSSSAKRMENQETLQGGAVVLYQSAPPMRIPL